MKIAAAGKILEYVHQQEAWAMRRSVFGLFTPTIDETHKNRILSAEKLADTILKCEGPAEMEKAIKESFQEIVNTGNKTQLKSHLNDAFELIHDFKLPSLGG